MSENTIEIRPLIAGNWKMNGLKGSLAEALAVRDALTAARPVPEVMICPPATILAALADAARASPLAVGAQRLPRHALRAPIRATFPPK